TPAEGANLTSDQPDFIFTAVSKANTTFSCELVINSTGYGTNATTANNTATTITANTTLADGNYGWYVSCTDNVGTFQSGTNTFALDATVPSVTINSPTANANLSTGTQVFNATVSDNSLAVVRFNITNSSGSVMLTASNPSGNFWNASVDLGTLAEEQHTATVLANDTVGNLNNSETVTFTVDRTAPTVTLVNSSLNTTDTTPSITFNYTDALFGTASCTLYFDGTAYGTSSVNNATDTAIVANATLSDATYSVTVNCTDGSSNEGASSSITVTVDTSVPAVTFNSPSTGSFHLTDFVVNVTATSASTVRYRLENGTNSSDVGSWISLSNPSGNFWNATITGTTADWNYTLRINATDSSGNSNSTETIIIGIDDTNPINVSVSCNAVNVGASRSCSCSANDNSESFGGSLTYGYSGDSTSTAGTTTVTCTATDSAGNTNSSTASYTVNTASSSGGGGSATTQIAGEFAKAVWYVIDANQPTSLEIENGGLGFTEVIFELKKKTYGGWLKAEKKDNLPSTVQVFEKKVYKYMEITKGNAIKDEDLSNIKIKFKVMNSWLTEQGLDKDSISLFRYVNGEWVELKTTIRNDAGTYIHYEAETPGFSYFLIGESEKTTAEATVLEETKTVPTQPAVEEVSAAETVPEQVEGKSYNWVWWTLGIIAAIVILGYLFWPKKK
ncbi:MAG: PGF-pre-PGF domain-containing protein, partial [Candidatus Woesearchaeota archaeon]